MEGPFKKIVAKLRESYSSRRDHMLDQLEREMPPGTEWTEPDGGFFVWVTLSEADAEALHSTAAVEGVIYISGSRFFPGEGGENRFRLSFGRGSAREIERAIAVLARIVRAA